MNDIVYEKVLEHAGKNQVSLVLQLAYCYSSRSGFSRTQRLPLSNHCSTWCKF
jgi:hypothetical protein